MAGRPREFNRDVALAAARDLFWMHGYEGTSMADLVKALGLVSSRIYAAFGSKQGLFQEAIGLYRSQEGGAALRALADAGNVRDGIESMLTTAVDTYARAHAPRGCMVVTAAANFAPENKAISDWLGELRRERNSAILSRLKAAHDTGELPAHADPQTLADFYGALLSGLSTQARDGVPRLRLLKAVRAAMKMLDQ